MKVIIFNFSDDDISKKISLNINKMSFFPQSFNNKNINDNNSQISYSGCLLETNFKLNPIENNNFPLNDFKWNIENKNILINPLSELNNNKIIGQKNNSNAFSGSSKYSLIKSYSL